MNKILTGIEGLDNICGGLDKGRAYLVSGEPGAGKTIFSWQFLLAGLKNGEHCLYISIDEKAEHLLVDMEKMSWDIKPYLENATLKILDVTSYFNSSPKTQDKNQIGRAHV